MALSRAETVLRYDCSAAALSPLAMVSRRSRSWVRNVEVLARLRAVRRSVWRARFSAERWFAMVCFVTFVYPETYSGGSEFLIIGEQLSTGQTHGSQHDSRRTATP